MKSRCNNRWHKVLAPICGLAATASALAAIAAFAAAGETKKPQDPPPATAAGDRAAPARDPAPALDELEKRIDTMRNRAEAMHRKMQEHARRMMEHPFDAPPWDGPFPQPPACFGPPEVFGPPEGIDPPEGADRPAQPALPHDSPPAKEFKGPFSYSHDSQSATGSSWSLANGKFRFRRQINGLKVAMEGAVANGDLDIKSIEIETEPGNRSRFGRVQDVPPPFRDEVDTVAKEARRRAN